MVSRPTLKPYTFLFVVFQLDELGNNIFKGIKFFRVPQQDIDGNIYNVWKDTVDKLKRGVQLSCGKNGRISNNFIKASDNMIIHVRPHTSKRSYVKSSNSNQLPTPAIWKNKPAEYSIDYMTTQCFFLNNTYIKHAVIDLVN